MADTPAPWLLPLPAATRLIFCGDEVAERALLRALALPALAAVCRAESGADQSLLWLGPDERLLLAPAEGRASLIASLETALAAHAHSLVDVSHRQLAFELRGAIAAPLLNAQCPLDLSLAAFPVGMCTRTVFAKAEIVLWRTAPEVFHVEVWRSFADYVVTLLRTVACEYLPGVSRTDSAHHRSG
jgi:sarcosine oxidase subunit gamma